MIRELVRLRNRNQITLPAEIVEKLAIGPGALLELILSPEGDHVELRHAQVVRAGTPGAERELKWAKEDVKEGRFSTFANPQELANDLKRKREEANNLEAEALDPMDCVREIEDVRKRLGLIEAHFVRVGSGYPALRARSKVSSKR
jgi:bifunctional DNA-binding transcriptional regulator/antitoxin component of YhaV-PrlF toxin-antitoxin module